MDAATVCLDYLLAQHLYPHDPSRVPLVVSMTGSGSGSGSRGAAGAELMLPDLVGLLAVDPVIMTPAATGAGYLACSNFSDTDSDGEDSVVHRMTTIASSMTPLSVAPKSLPPSNLGSLGEQYAVKWLSAQSWLVPGSVEWENAVVQAVTRDIVCQPRGPPGRSHVEVKTRWRRFKKAGASR